jgi:hypothetical protein
MKHKIELFESVLPFLENEDLEKAKAEISILKSISLT